MTVPARITVWLIFVFGAFGASAHEQNASVTRVVFNERTGSIEVMHRFSVHDIEHAGRPLFKRSVDVLENESDRQAFADYVYRQFTLTDQNGRPISLTPVGHEIDGRYLWVYSEAPIPTDLIELTVLHDSLLDVWATQSNLVNVQVGDSTQSATFVRGSSPATFAL